MKALTLAQPWASAMALGYKTIETRSWRTEYRGKGFPEYAKSFASVERACGRFPEGRVARGAVVCIVELLDCIPTRDVVDIEALERLYGDYAPGRWAWLTKLVEVLPEPLPAKGALGLWEWQR